MELSHTQQSYLSSKVYELLAGINAENLWKALDKLDEAKYRYLLKLCYEKDTYMLKKELDELAGEPVIKV